MPTPEAGSQSQSEVDKLPSKDKLATMSHSELFNLRDRLKEQAAIDVVAPFEHRAFAREYVEENPVTGAIGLVAAVPAYQAAKAVGYTSGDKQKTGASLEQMKQGLTGVAEGVAAAVKKPWEMAWNNVREALTPTPLPPKENTASKKPWEMSWGPGITVTKGTPTGARKRTAAEDAMAAEVAATDTGAGLTSGALKGILGDLEAGRLNEKQKAQLDVALKQLGFRK